MRKKTVAVENQRETEEQKGKPHPDVSRPGKKMGERLQPDSFSRMDDEGSNDHGTHEEREKKAAPCSQREGRPGPQKEIQVNPAIDEKKNKEKDALHRLFVFDHAAVFVRFVLSYAGYAAAGLYYHEPPTGESPNVLIFRCDFVFSIRVK